jgi:hypothetical protein
MSERLKAFVEMKDEVLLSERPKAFLQGLEHVHHPNIQIKQGGVSLRDHFILNQPVVLMKPKTQIEGETHKNHSV